MRQRIGQGKVDNHTLSLPEVTTSDPSFSVIRVYFCDALSLAIRKTPGPNAMPRLMCMAFGLTWSAAKPSANYWFKRSSSVYSSYVKVQI